MSNHSLADLSQYEVGRDRNIQIINDSLEINQVNKSILTIDIRLKKNVRGKILAKYDTWLQL